MSPDTAGTVVVDGCAIATVDGAGTEHADGHLVIAGGRIAAVGAGPAPQVRQDEIGSLEVGKLGDLALWRLDGLGHGDMADRVCALVFGPPAPLELLLVGGRVVVEAGDLRTADAAEVAVAVQGAAREIARRAGVL